MRTLSCFRMSVFLAASVAMLALAMGRAALAQGGGRFPSKPITLVVVYPAGGSADITARALAHVASKDLGQPIIVLNKAGAGTVVAMDFLKDQKPDGYTIGQIATAGVINQYMQEAKVNYDTRKDFTPIMQYAGWIIGAVVNADAPWKTFGDLLAYAKANPGKVRYSTAGIGTQQHLAMAKIGADKGIDWLHVPYKGGPDAVMAVLRGDVELAAQSAEWTGQVKDGRMRLLVTFGAKRTEQFPDAPSLAEYGINFAPPNILGIVGPAGMPRPVVERLHAAFQKGISDEQFVNAIERMSMIVTYKNPEELSRYIAELNDDWGPMIRRLAPAHK